MNIFDVMQTFVLEFWQESFNNIDYSQIAIALGVIALCAFLRRPIASLLIWGATFFIRKHETWRDLVSHALSPPFKILPIVIGILIALDMLKLDGIVGRFFENFTESWLIIIVFWTFYRLITPLGKIMHKARKVLTTVMVDWTLKLLQIFIVLLGIASILQLWGVQVAPLIAGLGLLSLGLGLGAQDLFKNLIAGLLIITEKRFHPGDWISVDNVVSGTVEKIGFRSTMVRQFDKAPVHVPNAKLSDNAVTNYSRMTHRRISWIINIVYDATKDQLSEVCTKIDSYIENNDAFAGPPAVSRFVRVDKFNDSSIDIMLYCFTKTTNWGEWLEIKEELAYQIKDIVKQAGTDFAYPTSTLQIKNDEVEQFIPPKNKGKTKA